MRTGISFTVSATERAPPLARLSTFLPAAVLARPQSHRAGVRQVKALLRKAAARTRDELWDSIGAMLDRFSPEECRNFIRHCGYACTNETKAL